MNFHREPQPHNHIGTLLSLHEFHLDLWIWMHPVALRSPQSVAPLWAAHLPFKPSQEMLLWEQVLLAKTKVKKALSTSAFSALSITSWFPLIYQWTSLHFRQALLNNLCTFRTSSCELILFLLVFTPDRLWPSRLFAKYDHGNFIFAFCYLFFLPPHLGVVQWIRSFHCL